MDAAWRLTGRTLTGLRTRAAVLLIGMVVSAAGCPDQPSGPVTDEVPNRQAAAQLTADDDRGAAGQASSGSGLRVWSEPGQPKPVELYVDLSQSMRGFLDAEFHTDSVRYRAVIGMLDARLNPTPIYGFGSTVRAVGDRARSTLENLSIYSDGNTQMEDVFPRIAADSEAGTSHLIIGDGRRADPAMADEQYARMRETAAQWIARGGTFAVAASLAPFKTVTADPSGCRVEHDAADDGKEGDGEEGGDGASCPLYAFAFIARGDEARVAAALAGRFEHLFVTPAPAAPDNVVSWRQITASPAIRLEPLWVERNGGGHVARARGDSATRQPLEAEITVAAGQSPAGRALAAALAGQGVRAELFARRLHGDAGDKWQAAGDAGQLALAGATPFRWRFISNGADEERIAYRIDLVPTGMPAWLGDFEAPKAGEPVRTYGLHKLFDGFSGEAAAPVLRAFVVVN